MRAELDLWDKSLPRGLVTYWPNSWGSFPTTFKPSDGTIYDDFETPDLRHLNTGDGKYICKVRML